MFRGKKMDIKIIQYPLNYVDILYLAGRGCYGMESLDNVSQKIKLEFIERLIVNKHESVLEHCIISIQIIGCSRSFMAQITRHRLVNFSIKSQHYVNHTDFEVKELETNVEEVQILYQDLIQIIRNRYKTFVNDYLIPIHVAREILPNSCLTNIFMTTNFREWRYIIGLRQTEKNTIEMRRFALNIKELFKESIMGIFEDL